ncbi:MAG: SLC13 family permease [Acidobacteriota bacterium]
MPALKHLLKLFSGPLIFALFTFLPLEGLSRSGQLVLATFLWALAWWITQPVPLGITALLPLILFPAFGVMDISATAGLYGQTIFFWVMGLALLGYAMQKHGLAKRFAIGLLSIKGVASTTHRLAFFYMLATGILSMFISDAGVVAMMIPIGLSVLSYIRTLAGKPKGRSPLGNFIVLGTLYGSIAGGVGTIAGSPTNIVAVSVLEKVTGETIDWFRWMKLGVPLFLVLLVIFYFILRFFFPPEFTAIPAGREFLRSESKKLGKMSRGEKNVLFTFLTMVMLFTIPSIAPFLLGAEAPAAIWLKQVLPIWIVPPAVMFMLFALPCDLKKREFTLMWKDAVEHAPWAAMLLCTGAVAMTAALSQFGFIEFVTQGLSGVGISSFNLPFIAAFTGTPMTELTSGTATTTLLGNILIPAAVSVGFNPASLAVLLSNVAIGKMFPWSGAPVAVAFASGEIEIKDLIKVALVADIVSAVTVALIHSAFAPVF